jgi:hypothetical protein
MKTLFPTRLLALAVCLAGCDPNDEGDTDEASDETTDESGTEGEEPITNACGTFDFEEAGDSVPPQDPDDPVIITACTALCDAQAGIEGCTTEAAACLEHCKMRSCDLCPDTLAPLVDCETAMYTGDACTCTAEGIDCPVPEGCSDLADQTGFCGG